MRKKTCEGKDPVQETHVVNDPDTHTKDEATKNKSKTTSQTGLTLTTLTVQFKAQMTLVHTS